jgi:FKBP-type peptidyl-prolyl cis-trans isomerase SlyD
MRIAAMVALALGLTLGTAGAQQQTDAALPVIQDGATVRLEYTLSLEDGKVLDSSRGREPLRFIQGQHEIVPGLEKALDGMRAGEAKQVRVEPADAYGDIDPRAVTEVPKDRLPAAALTVGTVLLARGPDGERQPVQVKEIKEQTVLLDLNHPLAGKTLLFDVKVVSVEPPAR